MTTTFETYRDDVISSGTGILGSIVWFSIAGKVDYSTGSRVTLPVQVRLSDLEQYFIDEDLDTAFLPPKPKKVDAYRKATGEASALYPITTASAWSAKCPVCGVKYDFGDKDPNVNGATYECQDAQCKNAALTPVEKITQLEGVTAELMVREVSFDAEHVVRHIVKETKDGRNKRLAYDPHVATLTFFRGTKRTRGTAQSGETLKCKIMPSITGEDRIQAEAMVAQIEAKYNDLAEYLHADAIRAVVRNYITYLNAISVRPGGGVYFVHISRQKTLDALERMLTKVGQGCLFHQLPLVDVQKADGSFPQREMLTDRFQAEVEDEVRALLAEVITAGDKVRDGKGKLTDTRFAELNGRYQDILARSEEYTRVLGLAQGRSATALELAQEAVFDLGTKVT